MTKRLLPKVWSFLVFLVVSVPAAGDYQIVIAGVPVHCGNYMGQPVNFLFDPTLPDVGRAILVPMAPEPTIILNPQVLSQFSPEMQLFWYGHECAHHVVGANEMAADCFSIQVLRNMGVFNAATIPVLQSQILGASGSMWGHLPGPVRANHFANCFATPGP